MTPADASDPTAVAFKIVYLLICVCIVYFFKVPRSGKGLKAAVRTDDSSHDNTAGSSSFIPGSKRPGNESVVVAEPVEVIDSPSGPGGHRFRSSDRSVLKKDILANDGAMRERFYAFVKARYASESLACFDAIVRFKQMDSAAARDRAGIDIVARFIAPGGADTITTPDAVRRGLEALTTFPPEAFDVVQTMCFNVLKDNFLAEFLEQEPAS